MSLTQMCYYMKFPVFQVSPDTTVNEVIRMMLDRLKRSASNRDIWSLHEIVRKELGELFILAYNIVLVNPLYTDSFCSQKMLLL